MFVIMDLEWVMRNEVVPTQLAAVRVNASWEAVGRFNMLIRPTYRKISWKHVAFSGHERDEFRNAHSAAAVFRQFSLWLQPDDTMIWWKQGPSNTFLQLCNTLLNSKPIYPMRMIRPAVREALPEREYIGSAHELADEIGVDVPQPEHCSANDAEAIRQVCAYLRLNQTKITATKTEREPGRHLKTKENVAKDIPDLPYYYDHRTGFLHRQDCPNLRHSPSGRIVPLPFLTGHGSLKNCIREGYAPCACCKEEYQALDEQLRQRVIKETSFSFVFPYEL